MNEGAKPRPPLPEQSEGAEKNITDSVQLANDTAANAAYEETKRRLLAVNGWNKLCGYSGAVFQLTDEHGNRIEESPKAGKYIRIDIPGPGAPTGRGYDWVHIESIMEEADDKTDTKYILMRVRPASDPRTANNDTAHFFSDKATSNFLVMKEGRTVTAAVLGRNEVTNVQTVGSVLDKIRNFIVGTGAKLGMADIQWKKLVEGLLGKKHISA